MNMTKVSFEKIKITPELRNDSRYKATLFSVQMTKMNCRICIIKWYIIYNNFTISNFLAIPASEQHKLTFSNI